MSQVAMTNPNSSRAVALQRRKAMSSTGKAAIKSAGNTAAAAPTSQATPAKSGGTAGSSMGSVSGANAREVSLARRKAMSTAGKAAIPSKDRTRIDKNYTNIAPAQVATNANVEAKGCGCGCGGTKKDTCVNGGKAPASPMSAMPQKTVMPTTPPKVASSSVAKTAALARRKALSKFGKAGAASAVAAAVTEVQAAREINPNLSSRELSRELRDQRSKAGNAGQEKSAP